MYVRVHSVLALAVVVDVEVLLIEAFYTVLRDWKQSDTASLLERILTKPQPEIQYSSFIHPLFGNKTTREHLRR